MQQFARYTWITEPPATPPIEPAFKRLRALARHLEHLTAHRSQEQNRMEGVKDKLVMKSIKAIVKRYDQEVETPQMRLIDIWMTTLV